MKTSLVFRLSVLSLAIGLPVLGLLALGASDAAATPLLAMQAAERCDACHQMPDRSDPKWVEANYSISRRECRLSCGVCHVNPSGGMLRTAAGQFYGTRTLPFIKSVQEDVAKAVALLKENGALVAGLDTRFMDVITNQDDKSSPMFFPMQGDLYLSARLHANVSLLSQFGLERGGNGAVREAFGLVDNLPYNAYLKFGKFIPPYGHRLEDHTAYVRRELFVDQSNPVSYSSGVEIGAEPLVAFVRAAYFNRDLLPRENTDTTPRIFAGTVGWQGLWLELGGSYLHVTDNDRWGDTYGPPSDLRGNRTAGGAFGAVRLGKFAWLFEGDLRTDDIAGQKQQDAVITFNELAWHAADGLILKVRHEYFDPDRDAKDDATQRYGIGIDLHPYPYTELDMQLRQIEESDPTKQDYYQLILMVHLWL